MFGMYYVTNNSIFIKIKKGKSLAYYNDFYHFGKIIGEFQFATSSCYSKKEVNEMNKVIWVENVHDI